MMMIMLFSKKKTLPLLGSAIVILLCISANALSVSSGILIQNTCTIKTGGEYPPSTFTYRIFKNSTSTYRINSLGFVDSSGSDPAVVINNAMDDCSAAGGGSIYVVPNTYLTGTPVGSSALYNKDYSNVYLELGNGTIIRRTSGGNENDYTFYLYNFGTGTTNFTLTSNGTAYFDANNHANGASLSLNYNCTFQNIVFEHLYGQGIQQRRSRYCTWQNITVYSYDESYEGQSAFASNDVQYSTFKNITLDGNNQANTRVGFYLSDWEDTTGWDGTYFNTVQGVWIKNNRRDGFYLNSGASGWHVYNNTFTNCTIENNWQGGYNAIKLRPAQNNTFTNIIIRNWTDPITTGTSYDIAETPGNCSGNRVTAMIYGSTLTSFILTTDGNNQAVDHNFFNLTIVNSKNTWFSSGTNSFIHDNTAYLNFTNCEGGLYFESGYFSNNIFVCNFSNTLASGAGNADIWFYNNPNFDPNITGNQIRVIAHGTNTFLNFTNGTRQNFVYYPWKG